MGPKGRTVLHGAIKKIHKTEFSPTDTGDRVKFWPHAASEDFVWQKLAVHLDKDDIDIDELDEDDQEDDASVLQQCAAIMQAHHASFHNLPPAPPGNPRFPIPLLRLMSYRICLRP